MERRRREYVDRKLGDGKIGERKVLKKEKEKENEYERENERGN